MALPLAELERQVGPISHSEEAIHAVQAFSNGLARTKARLEVWSATDRAVLVAASKASTAISMPVTTVNATIIITSSNGTISGLRIPAEANSGQFRCPERS
jgi:hypothetical protein